MCPGVRLRCHRGCSRKVLVFPGEMADFLRGGHVFSREVPECSMEMNIF